MYGRYRISETSSDAKVTDPLQLESDSSDETVEAVSSSFNALLDRDDNLQKSMDTKLPEK